MTPGTFIVINVFTLLLLGFAVFGRSWRLRTTYTSLLLATRPVC